MEAAVQIPMNLLMEVMEVSMTVEVKIAHQPVVLMEPVILMELDKRSQSIIV
jgi:hypothetical protein